MSQQHVDHLRHVAEDLATTGAAHVMRERVHVAGVDPWRQGRPRPGSADVVTDVDLQCEDLIRARIAVLRPQDSVLGQERGGMTAGPGVVQWLVDPINTTVNFRRGLPIYAVSVAARLDGVVLAGAVAEPATGRVWSAGLGDGARVHDPRIAASWLDIRVAATRDPAHALLATGLGRTAGQRTAHTRLLTRVVGHLGDLRMAGSPALALCWVAAGAVDAYVEHDLHLWDYAAAALIAEEAGALVHPPGLPGPAARLGGPMFAAAPHVADALLDLLAAAEGRDIGDVVSHVVRPEPPPATT